ncbi:hypothetical protein CEXT_67651 [Caerostris extrusa]|uniref:Uncharacterized protein n=1 Tax=Caerostris extrusa TaxID=172846 RepID=A0AAV4MNN8_CAEEX|nr:hypothetical protein CEXT_67651 [Caerostris extrusa]
MLEKFKSPYMRSLTQLFNRLTSANLNIKRTHVMPIEGGLYFPQCLSTTRPSNYCFFYAPLIKLRPAVIACALHTFRTSLLSQLFKPFGVELLLRFTMGHKRSRILLRAFLARQLTEFAVTVGLLL